MLSIIRSVLKDGNPFLLNTAMFVPAIIGQGTPRQRAVWAQRALNYDIIGTYAQVGVYGFAVLCISD
jgi:acyl-CoA oxidase